MTTPNTNPKPRDLSSKVGSVMAADKAAGGAPLANSMTNNERELHAYMLAQAGQGCIAKSYCITCHTPAIWVFETFNPRQNYSPQMLVAHECKKCGEGSLRPIQTQHKLTELNGVKMAPLPPKPEALVEAGVEMTVVCTVCDVARKTLVPRETALSPTAFYAALPCSCVLAGERSLHRIVRTA